jgi:5-carboxymethyl-2-hydroxymuconate isomerase
MLSKLEFEDGERLECAKIVCMARNYVAHINELNNARPKRPIFFMKPSTAIVNEGKRVLLPSFSQSVHHEVELAVVIGKSGHAIPQEKVNDYILGYGVAIDLTARDLQQELKDGGYPWEIAKAFDQSCPISKIRRKEAVGDILDLSIELSVNGELRQSGRTSQMIYPVAEMIAEMSNYFTLNKGDVILTGTPSGVAELRSGDIMIGEIERVGRLNFEVM